MFGAGTCCVPEASRVERSPRGDSSMRWKRDSRRLIFVQRPPRGLPSSLPPPVAAASYGVPRESSIHLMSKRMVKTIAEDRKSLTLAEMISKRVYATWFGIHFLLITAVCFAGLFSLIAEGATICRRRSISTRARRSWLQHGCWASRPLRPVPFGAG